MKIDLLVKFSVTKQLDKDVSKGSIKYLLVDNENILLAFSHVRDKVWFTDKRIIAMDAQGFTGSKKEYRSFPYPKISSFSFETAGTYGGDSDFKIWVSGVGVFEIKFQKNLNIKEIGKLLSDKILL